MVTLHFYLDKNGTYSNHWTSRKWKADSVIYFLFHAGYAFRESSRGYPLLMQRLQILIKYIWNFDHTNRERIEAIQKSYPHVKFITFRHSQEAGQYLEKLQSYCLFCKMAR